MSLEDFEEVLAFEHSVFGKVSAVDSVLYFVNAEFSP
jgi:hypothetical protein